MLLGACSFPPACVVPGCMGSSGKFPLKSLDEDGDFGISLGTGFKVVPPWWWERRVPGPMAGHRSSWLGEECVGDGKCPSRRHSGTNEQVSLKINIKEKRSVNAP